MFKELQKKLYLYLEKPEYINGGFYFQFFLFLVVTINIISFVVPEFFSVSNKLANFYSVVNKVTVIIFIIELILRYIVIGVDPKYRGVVGRFKFTFTPYIIIDWLAILPFILLLTNVNLTYIRYLRFARLLKYLRLKKYIKKFFSMYYFASSNIFIQSLILFIFSLIIMYLFSFGFDSFKKSANIFLDPTATLNLNDAFLIILGVIELTIGLFIGGALISIITSSFLEIINAINSGYLTYKGKNHIVIFNNSPKLSFVLNELNTYYNGINSEKEVVIVVDDDEVTPFKKDLENYSNLSIVTITGDPYNWNLYNRIGINRADKFIYMKSGYNNDKKVVRYILSNQNFNNQNLEFIIETDLSKKILDIYNYIFSKVNNKYITINDEELIASLLARSIVNYQYFQVLTELLSFRGSEIYLVKAKEFFKNSIDFKKAAMLIKNGVLLGVVRENEVLLNPGGEIKLDDKLIVISENQYAFSFEKDKNLEISNNCYIKPPKLKESKKIAIIGDNTKLNMEEITQFLDEESVKQIEYINKANAEYLQCEFWEGIENKNFDVIILNLEDDLQLNITFLLKERFKENQKFLEKIVNIFKEPLNARLLQGTNEEHRIILSEKVVGEFISQAVFNIYIDKIFQELTHVKGYEFYILNKDEYEEIFKLDYLDLKKELICNDMIYIGAFVDGKFEFDSKDIKNSREIVILGRGKDNKV